MIRIRIDEQQMKEIRTVLGHVPKSMPKAIARAINSAAVSGKKAAVSKIKETYFIKSSTLSGRRLYISKAKPSSTPSAFISSKSSVVPLSKFRLNSKSPQKKSKTLKVAVKKEGGLKSLPTAFIATMKSGHTNVFEREGGFRFPIKGKYGPSVAQMLDNTDVTNFIAEKTREVLPPKIDREIRAILGGFVK